MIKMTVLIFLTLAAFVSIDLFGNPSKTVKDELAKTKDGVGLVAHYYRDSANWKGNWPKGETPTVSPSKWTFTKYEYSRVEPLVNHLYIRSGWFSVRWKGNLLTAVNGKKDMEAEYTFHIWADDGCRLIIDGKTVINSWKPAWELSPESHRKATVKLKPGSHRIVIEYFQGPSLKKKDKDPIKVSWECATRKIPKQIIPASHFTHLASDNIPSKGAK